MMGLSDFWLYEKRVELQKVESKLDTKIKEIKIIHQFFGDKVHNIQEIDEKISKNRAGISELENELTKEPEVGKLDGQEEVASLRSQIAAQRAQIRTLLELRSSYSFDISDSKRFINSLSSRLCSIIESKKVISALSDIGFHFCPACFNVVDQDKEGCRLCGIDLVQTDFQVDPTFKIRKEIEFQIKESSQLIEKRQGKLDETELQINQRNSELEDLLLELSYMERPIKEISATQKRIIQGIGALQREIKHLNKGKEQFAKLIELYDKQSRYQERVTSLKNEIERKERAMESEWQRKSNQLSKLTRAIIQRDKDHEEIFLHGKNVDFSFSEDRVAIDGRLLFSASSMVYLKNAFRLALFEASCIDKTYLYPRFLLIDNVEDKGMAPDRSHTFQKEIIRISNRLKVSHQIIFTTSMISDQLEDSYMCVGKRYDDNNKSLNFSK